MASTPATNEPRSGIGPAAATPRVAAPDRRPVGVFDSGVGGVTILREILAQAPTEHCLYVADSREAPYGEKPPWYIVERCERIVDFLLARDAKVIVVACNTASVVALTHLRQRYTVPIVGIVPAVKPAVALTRTGKIGVLATPTTAQSEPLAQLIEEFAEGVAVVTEVCPELVPLIERGMLAGPEIEEPLRRHLDALLAAGVDVIALGCTHYPLLRELIGEICGPSVAILNPADAVARQLCRVLATKELESDASAALTPYFTTGSPGEFREVLRLLVAPEPASIEAIDLDRVDVPW
ncbi:MAG: glutamate racemase [Chloroflexota bacterium]|jgi:glutamate racemase|nr:glutamate racemase [Chloroflexota bacterium]